MGQTISDLFNNAFAKIFGTRNAKMVMIGLDAAGKTCILYKFKFNESINTVPTIGFNVETFVYKNTTLCVWDVGGQNAVRKLWGHYFEGCDAVIFVVDSADRERIPEAREELKKVLSDYRLKQASLLVYANKQDLPNAMKADELGEALDLHSLNRKWYIQPSVATLGEGLYDGLDWVSQNLPPASSHS